MDYLKYALQRQARRPVIEIFGGVGPDVIAAAEKILGIGFPDQYRAFLSGCGSCGLPGDHISGLFTDWDNLNSTGSTLHDTLEARKNHDLPREYIVLSYLPDENYHLLKVSSGRGTDDGAVYSADVGSGGSLTAFDRIFDSFADYFRFALDGNG